MAEPTFWCGNRLASALDRLYVYVYIALLCLLKSGRTTTTSHLSDPPIMLGIHSLEELKELTYEWKFVLAMATIYTVAVKLANRSRPRPPAAFTRTATFKWLCVLHNSFLAAYSAWTFCSAVPIIHKRFSNKNVPTIERICCTNRQIFDDGLDRLTYLFYLSKYYEVIDTIIILAKGKKSPLLQSYHHAGAMITMFGGAKYQAVPIWLFVVFNSFIHSIM